MQVCQYITDLKAHILKGKRSGKTVGFIPTMGALHRGHISLLERASMECDISVVSIFVNPTQFNNTSDLQLYPRTQESDLLMLEQHGCHYVFVPSVAEIYPEPKKDHWDFGLASSTLEAHYRPGHFDGVLTVVKRFFEIVMPDKAYFGEKDFQQLSLISMMTRAENLAVEIVPCPIVREIDGLAMSSRNMRLAPGQREIALGISKTLYKIKDYGRKLSPPELALIARRELARIDGLLPEYFEIVDAGTFVPVNDWKQSSNPIALVAAYVGDLRLIDNIRL